MKNKVALVTGASQGLGFAIAKELSEKGYSVILVSRNKEKLEKASGKLNPTFKHYIFAIDLTQANAFGKLYKFVKDKGIMPEVIINNLGGKIKGDDQPLNPEILKKSLRLNLEVAIEINNLFIPKMIKQKYGRIIHISSTAGITGNAAPAYTISKGALNAYIKNMARFYAKYNIMICAVLPGILDHAGSEWDKKKVLQPLKYKQRRAQMPLGRFGQPEEIADIVVCLCTSKSMMCAGSLINLEGGQ